MTDLTDAQRRVLVDLSEGDWMPLVPHHPRSTVARLYALGLIRCNNDHDIYEHRVWTITPDGDTVLRSSE